MTIQILVVEDEKDLVLTLRYAFEKEGFTGEFVTTGAAAFQALSLKKPDLILLDLMLPDMSGIEICKQIRADQRYQNIPVIMATAKEEEQDRVDGFEAGADDYVTKPFSLRELMLRVNAVLRRQKKDQGQRELSHNELQLNLDAKSVFVDNKEVKLTSLEYKLLETLLERQGNVQTRETLLCDVWNVRPELATRTIDTTVKRLRVKLGTAGQYVETVRGFGYRFCK